MKLCIDDEIKERMDVEEWIRETRADEMIRNNARK